MLLALDTSTRLAGIALYDGTLGLVAESLWHSANQHTVELMPHVQRMLSQAGRGVDALTAVGVALGPGSFTGLRVALAAAKGLALAAGIPLIGISTLDAIAYAHSLQPLPVVALVQAGRGRLCWARYANGARETAYGLATVAGLAEQTEGTVLFAGETYPETRSLLRDLLGERAHLPAPALAARRAGCLAELAWQRFERGEADDLAALAPIYLHEPVRQGEG